MAKRKRRRRPPTGVVERIAGHRRHRWSEELAALLGRIPDLELARRAGVSLAAVRDERQRRGIDAFMQHGAPTEWTPEMEAQLGIVSDGEVARTLGLTVGRVAYRRSVLGIPPFSPERTGSTS